MTALRMALATLSVSIQVLFAIWRKGASIKLCDLHTKIFSDRLIAISDTEVVVVGLENIDPNQSYVFMSNHSSLMDIPILYRAIPNSLRMVAKTELFKIPIFGPAMRSCGFVEIDRKNKEKAISQLENAKVRLREGISIWVAPEGTRSRTGQLGPFKKGGFHVAMMLGVPIVPIWIDGTDKVMKPHSLIVCRHKTATVYIGNPVSTSNIAIDLLMQSVKSAMTSLVDKHS